jgi:hypothetical protein
MSSSALRGAYVSPHFTLCFRATIPTARCAPWQTQAPLETRQLQVSVKLPAGCAPLRLTDSKPHSSQSLNTGLRTSSGAEALQVQFSSLQAVVTNSDYDPSTPEVLEDEVLENERAMPFQGFKPTHLLPLDPKRSAAASPCLRACTLCSCALCA